MKKENIKVRSISFLAYGAFLFGVAFFCASCNNWNTYEDEDLLMGFDFPAHWELLAMGELKLLASAAKDSLGQPLVVINFGKANPGNLQQFDWQGYKTFTERDILENMQGAQLMVSQIDTTKKVYHLEMENELYHWKQAHYVRSNGLFVTACTSQKSVWESYKDSVDIIFRSIYFL